MNNSVSNVLNNPLATFLYVKTTFNSPLVPVDCASKSAAESRVFEGIGEFSGLGQNLRVLPETEVFGKERVNLPLAS
jgi:hypothetical protein